MRVCVCEEAGSERAKGPKRRRSVWSYQRVSRKWRCRVASSGSDLSCQVKVRPQPFPRLEQHASLQNIPKKQTKTEQEKEKKSDSSSTFFPKRKKEETSCLLFVKMRDFAARRKRKLRLIRQFTESSAHADKHTNPLASFRQMIHFCSGVGGGAGGGEAGVKRQLMPFLRLSPLITYKPNDSVSLS